MRAALAVLAAVPALALAQVGALDAARQAGAGQQEGAESRARAADAQLAEPPAAPAAPAKDGSVDLGSAAARLEREVGALPGTEVDVGPTAAGESYTVQRGDTLWDLSAKVLQDPFSWPKIWSWNPQVANPHWIYPGNVLRLAAPGAKGEAAQVAGAPAPAEAPADDSDLVQPPQELADFSRSDMKKPQEFGEGDEVAIAGSHRIGITGSRVTRARHDSFVTRNELAESGVISAAFEDKLLLSVSDRAYARFHQSVPVKVGQSYAVFKTERELRHPTSKQLFGYKTSVIGAARVVALDDKAATLVITSASDPIERGAYLAPAPVRPSREVPVRPNQKAISGVIVAAEADVVSEMGEHHVVYVDCGTADGVEEGNVFTVLRSGDPYGKDIARTMTDPRLPTEDIGALLVVDAKEHASAALVVKSNRELLAGDRVEMRVAGPRAGAGSN